MRGQWLYGRLDIVLASLSSEHTFCGIAVTLALAVFLVGILNRDFFVDEVLAIHARNGVIGGFKVGKGDEAVAFG